MKPSPDYSKYNLGTLYKILTHMNKKEHPHRVNEIVQRIRMMEERSLTFYKDCFVKNRLKYALLEKETQALVCQDFFACFKRVHWTHYDVYLGFGLLLGAEIFVEVLKNLKHFGISTFSLFIIILFVDLCLKGTLFYYPYYICRKRNIWPLFSFKSLPNIPKEILPAFGFYILIIGGIGLVTLLITYLTQLPVKPPEAWKWLGYVPRNVYFISFLIFSFSIVPLIEEVFFRGFLYNALKRFLPPPYAIILQAALFAMLHPYDLMNRISIFMMGIGFAIAYERRKNLISPILIHSMINLAWVIRVLLS